MDMCARIRLWRFVDHGIPFASAVGTRKRRGEVRMAAGRRGLEHVYPRSPRGPLGELTTLANRAGTCPLRTTQTDRKKWWRR